MRGSFLYQGDLVHQGAGRLCRRVREQFHSRVREQPFCTQGEVFAAECNIVQQGE